MTTGVSGLDYDPTSLPTPIKKGHEPYTVDTKVQKVRETVPFNASTAVAPKSILKKGGRETDTDDTKVQEVRKNFRFHASTDGLPKPTSKNAQTDYRMYENLPQNDFYGIEQNLNSKDNHKVTLFLEEHEFSEKQLKQLLEENNRLRLPQFLTIWNAYFGMASEPNVDDAAFLRQYNHSLHCDLTRRALKTEFKDAEGFKQKLKEAFDDISYKYDHKELFGEFLKGLNPATKEFWDDFFTDTGVVHLPKFLEVSAKLGLEPATVSEIKKEILNTTNYHQEVAQAILRPLLERRAGQAGQATETLLESLLVCVKNCPWANALLDLSEPKHNFSKEVENKILSALVNLLKINSNHPRCTEVFKNVLQALIIECQNSMNL
jgi:hypothetical protein